MCLVVYTCMHICYLLVYACMYVLHISYLCDGANTCHVYAFPCWPWVSGLTSTALATAGKVGKVLAVLRPHVACSGRSQGRKIVPPENLENTLTLQPSSKSHAMSVMRGNLRMLLLCLHQRQPKAWSPRRFAGSMVCLNRDAECVAKKNFS